MPAPIEIAPGRSLVGLSSAGELIRFRSDAPDTASTTTGWAASTAASTVTALRTDPMPVVTVGSASSR